MKNLYALLSLFLTLTIGYSQDTIGVQSLPKPGFTYVVSNDTVTNYLIPSTSSTHQIWDFSHLVENYPKMPTYDSTSKTPYASLYPTSNLYTYGPAILYSGFYGSSPVLSQGSDNGYMFWLADSTGFWVEGFKPDNGNSGAFEVHNQPHELLIPLPGILNKVTHSESTWQVELNANPSDLDTTYISRVKKTFNYDAFGELTTPNGQYSKVLRLHEYTIKTDSIYAHISGMGYSAVLSRDTTNTYYYLDKETDYPMLTMYADAQNKIKYTEYFKMKLASTMDVNKAGTNVKNNLYPNPFNTQLICEIEGENAVLEIMSLKGQLIKKFHLNNGINHLDVNEVNAGLYIAVLRSLDGKAINYFKILK